MITPTELLANLGTGSGSPKRPGRRSVPPVTTTSISPDEATAFGRNPTKPIVTTGQVLIVRRYVNHRPSQSVYTTTAKRNA